MRAISKLSVKQADTGKPSGTSIRAGRFFCSSQQNMTGRIPASISSGMSEQPLRESLSNDYAEPLCRTGSSVAAFPGEGDSNTLITPSGSCFFDSVI